MPLISIVKSYIRKNFHSLSHLNFRIFWSGQIISLIGSWMQTISLPWLAYSLTKSPLLLGVVGALQFTPMLFLSLFVGALLDRFEKKKILIFTQISLAVLALILSVLVFTHIIRYWQIILVAGLIGIINAIDMPGRQTFIIELVGKKDLMNAIGLNSAIFNGARIVGPALAGILMAGLGMGFCFFINAVSFIPVIAGLFFIKPLFSYHNKSNKNILHEVAEGLRYMHSEKLLFSTIIMVFIVGTFIMNFNVLVPVLTKEALKLGERGFGFLMSSMGVGSLLGALIVAVRSKNGPKSAIMKGAAILVSVVFVLIGLNKSVLITAGLLALAGFLTVTFLTTANSTLQLNSRDEFRSRAVSVYSLVNAGTTPIGNLITGGVTDALGIKMCFIIIGAGVFIMIAVLSLSGYRKRVMPDNSGRLLF
jgi:MFS family permease